MSYIRLTSEGRFCDLGDGSCVYAYDNGKQIVNQGKGNSLSYKEFAYTIFQVFKSVGLKDTNLKRKLEEKFGGIKKPSTYPPYPRPELGEVACRVAINRLNVETITQEEASMIAREYKPKYGICECCGERTRLLDSTAESVHCPKEGCEEKHQKKRDEDLADEFDYKSVKDFIEREKDF